MYEALNTLIHMRNTRVYCPSCKGMSDTISVDGTICFESTAIQRAVALLSKVEAAPILALIHTPIAFTDYAMRIDDKFERVGYEEMVFEIVNEYAESYQIFDMEIIKHFIKNVASVELVDRCACCRVESNIVTLQLDDDGERMISSAPIHNVVCCKECGHHSTTFIAEGTLHLSNGDSLPFIKPKAFYFDEYNIELGDTISELLFAYKQEHTEQIDAPYDLKVIDICEQVICENCHSDKSISIIV